MADELKKRDVPVILGPVMALPHETGRPVRRAVRLRGEAARGGGAVLHPLDRVDSNTRNLPYEAAMAVAYGLPPEEGLKAVTLYPAQILGVADQLGSIEAGKRANLVIANGDMLQPSTQVLAAVHRRQAAGADEQADAAVRALPRAARRR